MSLKFRGSSQFKPGSIPLSRLESQTSKSIIGYDSDGNVSALTSGEARTNMEISISDNVQFENITGSAITGSSLTSSGLIASNLTSGTGLQITADSDLNGALDVQGAVNLQSTLTVAGLSQLDGGLNSDGDLSVRDSSDVSKFSVLSASGNTSVGGTLGVTGAATLDSTLTVTGASTLASMSTSGVINHTGTGADNRLTSGNVNITGGSIIKNVPIGDSSNRSTGHFSSLDVNGDLTVGGNLTVSGSLTTVETSNLIVKDPMILLSKGNTLSNQSFSKIDSLGASDGVSGDAFGYGSAISRDGDVLVVGSPYWEGSTQDQGGVYIYDWSDTDNDGTADSWVQRGSVLTASDAGNQDRFGSTCSINGDGSIIAIGSPQWDGNYFDQGTVYVYEYVSGSWTQKGSVLVPNDIGSQDLHFTVGLNSDGTILAVGSMAWDGSGGSNQGAVYVYDWNESTEDWDQRSRITASDAASGDAFGYDISLSSDGTIMAIGARDWEGTYSGQGGVYIYDWSDTDNDGTADSWVQRGDVIVSNSEGSGTIGFGVSTELNGDGTVLAVGQIGAGWSTQTNKHIEIFDWNSSTEVWDYRTKIDAESDATRTASQSGFGISLSMNSSGSKIVVGATNDNSGKGYVYSYELSGSNILDIGFMGSFVESSTDKSMGFFRDASDGYFKPFVTEQNLSSTNTIDVSDASYVKGTIEAEFRGDITFANDVTIGMHADSDLSGSSTWDGNSNLSLDLKIKDDSIQVGNLDFFAHDNTLGGESSSDVKVPSQQSVKSYVDAAVSSGGLTDLESKDILMVDSTGKYIKARKIVEYLNVSSTDQSNSYILASTEIETEFKDLSNVYLNGQKLRYSSDNGTSNDYWFSETGPSATLHSKTLTASDQDASDVYTAQGISMSDDGNILAVVSRDWDRPGGGSNHGGVYIYDWDSTNEEWDQRGDVFSPPSDATNGILWGHSVSLSSDGSYMAVGSVYYTDTATHQGGVYVYKWNSSTNSWDSHGSVVVASDAGSGDRHIMPSLSGDASVLAVGAFSWDGSGKTNDGKVYIYDWDSTNEEWDQRTTINASDAASYDYFGMDVSLSDDASILAIGSGRWEGDTADQGGVYIYDWTDTDEDGTADSWVQRGDVIESNNPSVSAYFGYAVELNNAGTTLIVGSSGAGKAEIFDWNSSTSSWDFRTSVSDPVSGGINFGGSVAINSDATKFVVGSYGNGSNVAGRAHTYDLTNTSTTNRVNFNSNTINEDDRIEISYIIKS